VPANPTAPAPLAAAPHRALFLAGAVQLLLAMALWAAELLARLGLVAPLPWTIAPLYAHGFLLPYTVFAFFVFGFLFTVYPRWLATRELPAARWRRVARLLVAGVALVYLGLFLRPWLIGAGAALLLGGWGAALALLAGAARAARRRGAHVALLSGVTLPLGALGVALYGYGAAAASPAALAAALPIGLWGFLVPTILIVAHRMLPFFTESALPGAALARPGWTLWASVAGSLGHGALELAAAHAWLIVPDLALTAAAAWHSVRWARRGVLGVRLLGMLHIALAWLTLAMLLYLTQDLARLAGLPDPLGRAPLHALAIGFAAGMLVAMVTRVTLGHSGRALVADTLSWHAFLGLNAVAAVRVAAELAPAAQPALNALAALGWLACLLPWAWRYAPMYWRARIDGAPG
jgi:uncharacterized protein involved in response to NO